MTAGKFRVGIPFTLVLALAWLVVPSFAQINARNSTGFGPTVHGVPPSVTSLNFGGQPGPRGLPASVTSLGFGDSRFAFNRPFRTNHPFGFRHRNNFGFSRPFFGDVVAVPYAYPVYVMEPGVDDSMEDDYLGGPTIFDRRGPGQDYRRPQPQPREEREEGEDYRTRPEEPAPAATQPAPEKPVPQQPTVLVFRDGHQSEVLNYAIVGETLYELSDGRAKKVAIAELDLSATVKQNDERGVDFRVPGATKLN
jgi:hypothetical protein